MERTFAGDLVLGVPATSTGTARRALAPLALAVLALVTYVVAVVGPYLRQDLPAAGAAEELAFATVALGPPVVLVGGLWAVAALVDRRSVLDRVAVACLVAATAASALFLLLFFSPAGLDVLGWLAD
jgi:hypothetical protein